MRASAKIVILGTRDFRFQTDNFRVFSFDWDEVAQIENLRDYDVVILDLLNIPSQYDWQPFYDLLDARTMVDIVKDNGRIFMLGDPRFEINTVVQGGCRITRPFLEWTAATFSWDNAGGD